MTSSIEKMVESFPYPTLTPIAGIPDYESLAELHTQANCNSSSIQSNLGGGSHGLLALTLEASETHQYTAPLAQYKTVTTTSHDTVSRVSWHKVSKSLPNTKITLQTIYTMMQLGQSKT